MTMLNVWKGSLHVMAMVYSIEYISAHLALFVKPIWVVAGRTSKNV